MNSKKCSVTLNGYKIDFKRKLSRHLKIRLAAMAHDTAMKTNKIIARLAHGARL